ncbi:MAG: hypothetical protein KAJ19_08470, partial [Gammaproteobacteria bacterium]|nr:hypothetical protein [Gammaproteobacteria bacterium]
MKNLIILLAFFITSCGSGGSGGDETTTGATSGDGSTTSISAYVYDGPCLAGANVQAKMLVKETLAQTEEIYLATTSDYGYFDIATSADLEETPYALIKVTDAECHNEVTGGMMSGKTYYGMVDLTSETGRNIHPQTKGTIDRTVELYTNVASATYQDFEASQIKAEQEWMAMFGISGVTARFGDMALDGLSDGNAALLTMNAIHLQGNNEAEQAQFIQQRSDDIRFDGVLNDAGLIDDIKTNSQALDLDAVGFNLAARYQILGVTIDVPDFEPLVDSDGDGFLNGVDDNEPDVFSFNNVIDV